MKVYYITSDEVDEYDNSAAIWAEGCRFFLKVEKAELYLQELEDEGRKRHAIQQETYRDKWETINLVVEACKDADIDWKKAFPYYKNYFEDKPYKSYYSIRSIEVIE